MAGIALHAAFTDMRVRIPAARFDTRRLSRATLLTSIVLVIAGCATPKTDLTTAQPAQIRAEIVKLLPAQVSDRSGWANDMQVAFTSQDLAPTRENLCAVIAVIAQESSFQASPVIPGLPRIAHAEIDRPSAANRAFTCSVVMMNHL